MILAMLTLLMIQMQSFSRLAMVFFTAPLGIVGASIALNLAGKPFGFVALVGLIALAGMDMVSLRRRPPCLGARRSRRM
jgi:multidrug efflux pump subunit AcrB